MEECSLAWVNTSGIGLRANHLAQPGEMREKVRQIVHTVNGRGYIMTPAATPFMFPPPDEFVSNYVEFLKAAEELGWAYALTGMTQRTAR